MPATMTLHDLFLDELRDVYNAERQVTKALPKMIKAVSHGALRSALENHLEETQGQIERLDEIFSSLGERARGTMCDGMAGILEEGRKVLAHKAEDTTMDAAVVAAAQRVEHYEIAAYGTLVAWANAMGHDEVAALLETSLDEEKAADEKLTQVAESGLNDHAARLAHPEEDDGEEADEMAAPMAGARKRQSGAGGRGGAARSAGAARNSGGARGASAKRSGGGAGRGGAARAAKRR